MGVESILESFSRTISEDRIEECRKMSREAASETEAMYQGVSVEELRERYFINFLLKDYFS